MLRHLRRRFLRRCENRVHELRGGPSLHHILRLKKSEVVTGTPFAAAAASKPCFVAACNRSSAASERSPALSAV